MGFEPTTASLEGWNSTTELRPPVSDHISLWIITLNSAPEHRRSIRLENGNSIFQYQEIDLAICIFESIWL